MDSIEINITSLTEMQHYAARIALLLKPRDLLALKGNLGAGKSTFVRALIQSLDPNVQEVPSPTFTLVQHYEMKDFTIHHYDLYRLKDPNELYEIEIEDALEGVTIAEWPDLLFALKLPFHQLLIEIDFGEKEEERILKLSYDEAWKERIDDLKV
jgi:tRNA threonylcarbamoyladenosine biosynthesis protein TsaE